MEELLAQLSTLIAETAPENLGKLKRKIYKLHNECCIRIQQTKQNDQVPTVHGNQRQRKN